ncbi:hypothetical protein [Tenacibaculum finnmarkense]|uniref:hypothetical protein n=1 Tax=Tenacibaculum finnmarkense TaxID=2781243 RepID=UPI001E5B76F5|nr:hypothetical protein [Tenacibaculum finnmarkense]MCD8402260.1 hypothetical protein [Tenacibaculum finnmarkense genomovar finnmarkense]
MKLFGFLIFAIIFIQCANIKQTATPPFKIKKALYTDDFNHLSTNKSPCLNIIFTSDKPIDFQKVYFQNTIINTLIEYKNGKKIIIARYKNRIIPVVNELILNADSEKEYGNSLPKITEKFPFNLKDNQAVVTYKIGDKILTYKIENMIKTTSILIR